METSTSASSAHLGNVKSIRLVAAIKQDLRDLHQQFPQMEIIFSVITQRCQWRRVNPKKVDKARRFVNNVMTTFILSVCGCIVHHPQIKHRNPDQFLHDEVHFTTLGNDVFLNNIALCLKDPIQQGDAGFGLSTNILAAKSESGIIFFMLFFSPL